MLKFANKLFSFSLAFLLFVILAGPSRVWSSNGSMWLESWKSAGCVCIVLLFLSLVFARGKYRELKIIPEIFAFSLLLTFFSNWMCRGYSFLQAPAIRGEIILGSLLTIFILKKRMVNVFSIFTPLAIIIMASSFLTTIGSNMIFTDDHSSFYYRLMLLKENFPNIPFYNPLWNGGVESREFFPSGILNVFFLTSPLIYLFDVEKIYSIIVALILFIITPCITYFACKIEKLNHPIPAIAALIAVCNGSAWYTWALSYGTIGFITSASLLPILLVLIAKLLSRDDGLSKKEAFLFIIFFTLSLFWSMTGVILLPLIIVGLLTIKRVFKKKYTLGIIFVLFIINIPWIVVFVQASNVINFLDSEKKTIVVEQVTNSSEISNNIKDKEIVKTEPLKDIKNEAKKEIAYKGKKGNISLKATLKELQDKACNSNPLILFLAFPGILLFRRRTKKTYLLISLWLLLLGGLLFPLKPQLELDRMLIVLVYICAVPTAIACYEIIRRTIESPRIYNTTVSLLIGGFLFASPFSTSAILNNQTLTRYNVKSDTYKGLVEAIKTKAPKDGRIIFTGFILHELSNAHIAPLVMETGHPMIASSFHHNLWRYTDVVPYEYLFKNKKFDFSGSEEYFDVMNVSSVVAHENIHKQYYIRHPEKYELIWKGGHNDKFMLFAKKNYKSNYFYSGNGTILEQTSNHITLSLKTNEAIIKFTYLPFIQTSACKINKYDVSEHVSFIKLSECPTDTPIVINAQNAFERFFMSHFKENN